MARSLNADRRLVRRIPGITSGRGAGGIMMGGGDINLSALRDEGIDSSERAGVIAQPARDHLQEFRVGGEGPALHLGLGRSEEDVSRPGKPSGQDDHIRIEEIGEIGHADAEEKARLPHDLDGKRISVLGGLRNVFHRRVRVNGQSAGMPPLGQLFAESAKDPVGSHKGFQAAVVPAPTGRSVEVNRDVAALGA